MMFFIDWISGMCALLLALFLYVYITRTISLDHSVPKEGEIKVDWRSGRRLMAARHSLLALKEGDLDFKYWRPFIMFFCKTSLQDGAYVPQHGMINLISQFMKRGKGMKKA